MALIKCPECQREISDQAVSCPHCGFPLAKRQKETPKRDDIDFSSMEVLLKRGINNGVGLGQGILAVLTVVVSIILTIYAVRYLSVEASVFLILIFGCASYAITMLIIMTIKMKHNSKFKHDNLYYDEKTHQFYIETWQFEIIAIPAKDRIVLNRNNWTFCENTLFHNGKKYNLGYSSSSIIDAELRIKHIQKEHE